MWLTNLWDTTACKSNLTSGGINLLLVTRCDYCQHVEDTSRDMYGQRVDFVFASEIYLEIGKIFGGWKGG